MKNIVSFCFVIGCLMFLVGCSEDDNHQTIVPKFDVVQSSNIDLTAEGGVATVEFTSEGVSVEASVDVDWCQIEETTPNKVTLSVGVNEGYTSRSAVVTLTDGETTRQVTILQSGAVWIYDRDDTTIYVNENRNDVIVKMTGTFPFEISIPSSASTWVTGVLTTDGFKLKVQKNTTGKRRTASFTVKMKDRVAEYTVIQYEIDDLLGSWGGEMVMSAPEIGISDTKVKLSGSSITKTDEDNQYLISIPLKRLGNDVSLNLIATYKNGNFTVKTPQNQDYMLEDVLYSSIILASDEGLALEGNIVLTSNAQKGVVTYSYVSTNYFCMGFFTGKTPGVNNYSGYSIRFPEISFQKSLK